MDLLAGGRGERRKRLHQVHVRVESLAVAGAEACGRDAPVGLDVLVVAAAECVRGVLLEQVERAAGVVEAARGVRGPGVFAQGVDGEALAVDDLAVVEPRAVLPHLPEPAAVLGVPEVAHQEVHPGPGAGGEFLSAPRIAPGEPGEPPQQPALGVEVFLGRAGVPAGLVEVGEVAAVLAVRRALAPEGDDAVFQVIENLAVKRGQPLRVRVHRHLLAALLPPDAAREMAESTRNASGISTGDWGRKVVSQM